MQVLSCRASNAPTRQPGGVPQTLIAPAVQRQRGCAPANEMKWERGAAYICFTVGVEPLALAKAGLCASKTTVHMRHCAFAGGKQHVSVMQTCACKRARMILGDVAQVVLTF